MLPAGNRILIGGQAGESRHAESLGKGGIDIVEPGHILHRVAQYRHLPIEYRGDTIQGLLKNDVADAGIPPAEHRRLFLRLVVPQPVQRALANGVALALHGPLEVFLPVGQLVLQRRGVLLFQVGEAQPAVIQPVKAGHGVHRHLPHGGALCLAGLVHHPAVHVVGGHVGGNPAGSVFHDIELYAQQ